MVEDCGHQQMGRVWEVLGYVIVRVVCRLTTMHSRGWRVISCSLLRSFVCPRITSTVTTFHQRQSPLCLLSAPLAICWQPVFRCFRRFCSFLSDRVVAFQKDPFYSRPEQEAVVHQETYECKKKNKEENHYEEISSTSSSSSLYIAMSSRHE